MYSNQDQRTGYIAAIKAITNVDNKVDAHYLVAYNANVAYYDMYRPDEGKIIWWIKNHNSNDYIIYTFAGSDFISGFIGAADQLAVDFRDYVLAAPTGMQNGIIINYNIEGYDLLPYRSTKRVPASIGPFYVGSIEAGDNNVDWE